MVGVLYQALWEPVFALSGGEHLECSALLAQFNRLAGGCDVISLRVVSLPCVQLYN